MVNLETLLRTCERFGQQWNSGLVETAEVPREDSALGQGLAVRFRSNNVQLQRYRTFSATTGTILSPPFHFVRAPPSGPTEASFSSFCRSNLCWFLALHEMATVSHLGRKGWSQRVNQARKHFFFSGSRNCSGTGAWPRGIQIRVPPGTLLL